MYKYLTKETCETLILFIMASHLDYANSLFRIKQKTRNYFEENFNEYKTCVENWCWENRFVNLIGLVLDQELSLKLLLLSIKVHMERHQNIKKIFLRLKNPLK